ncbi:hypothetical protein CANCADRAFT_282 [Tortispora caseinolytica NRRL Y-17796]|uniref:Protein YAE1 n=1 Tax=Tortispora caseinolytica NRRL Y-17796 TaxID=767744 RepID=A0A1E4TIX4_9ASCO|nr:hypothetical protein CANCADRAFT_282 [Tortispora caseinolytica NRRL Y-17796]
MSDVWGSDEEFHDHKNLHERHYNSGYLEGVTKGKNNGLQRGFDDGYTVGSGLALKVGRIFGILQGLNNTKLIEQAKIELNVNNLFSKEYFDIEKAQQLYENEHPLVEKWESIVEELFTPST